MREILFKAKKEDNGEWVEGFYTLYSNGNGLHPCILTGTEKGCVIPEFVDPETVCQYTGLKDKNGVKIWEYDVVQYNDEVGVIEYHEYDAMYYANIECTLYDFGTIAGEWVEVIGNIFDNPELMGVIP